MIRREGGNAEGDGQVALSILEWKCPRDVRDTFLEPNTHGATKIRFLVAPFRTVTRSRLSLRLAMLQYLRSVSGRSTVPRIVVLRKTVSDVAEFVKQYHNLCFRSIPGVGRNHQQTTASGRGQYPSGILLHDDRSTVEERAVGI